MITAVEEPGDTVITAVEESGDAVITAVEEPGDTVITAVEEPGDTVITAVEEPGDTVITVEKPSEARKEPKKRGDTIEVGEEVYLISNCKKIFKARLAPSPDGIVHGIKLAMGYERF